MRARENPLRSECVQAVSYRPFGWTWEQLEGRLRELNFRGAIVGPEGSGKTTLLEALARRLVTDGSRTVQITLRRGQRVLPTMTFHPQEIVMLDGAEQLSIRAWRQFVRSTGSSRGVIITSHRGGLLPTLVNCQPSREALEYVLSNLLAPDELAQLHDATSDLFVQHRGNIRLVLWSLYDRIGGVPTSLNSVTRL